MFARSIVLALGFAAIAQSVPLSSNVARDAKALVVPARVELSAEQFGPRSLKSRPVLWTRSGTYTVVNGDTGDAIAAAQGITFAELSAANPGVNWNDLQIGQVLQLPSGSGSSASAGTATATAYSTSTTMMTTYTTATSASAASASTTALSAYSSSTASSTSSSSSSSSSLITMSNKLTNSLAVSTVDDNDGTATPADTYTQYSGDGSTGAGWPGLSDWISFTDMWNANVATINEACTEFGVANNSPTETQNIHDAIEALAAASDVDHRFILATIMQESKGCVRVPSTDYSVVNPGLMQSDAGTGTCNGAAGVLNPCPESEIYQMIQDGVMGTGSGTTSSVAALTAAPASGAQGYYQAARMYNSGLNDLDASNLAGGDATHCYASDVANRLTGWVTAESTCTFD